MKSLDGKSLYLFLDFDGTLTPIKNHPDSVFLDNVSKGIIRKLAMKSSVMVSIISGRELSDLEERVGVEGIIYAGNHGLEVKGSFGVRKLGKAVEAADTITEVRAVLEKKLKNIENVYIEDKGLSLSVHFRQVSESDQPKVQEECDKVIAPYRADGRVIVTIGKKVLEVRPPIDWHKGKIVQYLIKRYQKKSKISPVPIYIGDDVTDEDAFKVVNELSGYSVKICNDENTKSHANYYLKSNEEVLTFMSGLYIAEREKGEQRDV